MSDSTRPVKAIETRRATDLYRFFDARGTLLYVGISFSAIQRASAHRAEKGWWCEVERMTVEKHPTRDAALAAELQAIRTEHPIHNVAGAVPGAQPWQQLEESRSDGGLVGMFVLTTRECPHFHGYQGLVRDKVSDTAYLVQWMSWGDGNWTNASVVDASQMGAWRFYGDHFDFLQAGKRQMKETDRLLEAQLRATG